MRWLTDAFFVLMFLLGIGLLLVASSDRNYQNLAVGGCVLLAGCLIASAIEKAAGRNGPRRE